MTSPPPVSASREPLFTLHIATTGGRLVCTEPSPRLYLLTLTSPPDNRLTTEVCQTLLLALDVVEQKYPPGVLVTTSGIQKFYSNGLDLEHATSTPGFWESCLWPVFRRFISFVHFLPFFHAVPSLALSLSLPLSLSLSLSLFLSPSLLFDTILCLAI